MRRIASRAGSASSRATVLFLPQVIPLVAAGHRVELGARRRSGVVNQVLDGDRPRRRHPGMARRLRHRAAGGRRDRRLGAARSLHRAAARRHEQDRPGALRGRAARRRRAGARVRLDHVAEPAPGDRRLRHRDRDRGAVGFDIVYISHARRPRQRDDGSRASRSTSSRSSTARSGSPRRSPSC